MMEGITIPVKLVITPEIETGFLNLFKSLTEQQLIKEDIKVCDTEKKTYDEQKRKVRKGFPCTKCGSVNTESRGTRQRKKGIVKRHYCFDCDSWVSEYQKEEVNIPELSEDVITTDEPTIEQLIDGHVFKTLPENKKIQFIENGKYLIISNNGSIIKSTWEEVERLAAFERSILNEHTRKIYPNDIEKRYALFSFVRAVQDELIKKSENLGYIVFDKGEWNKLNDLTDWREEKDVLVIRYRNSRCETSWDYIEKLTQLDKEKRRKEIYKNPIGKQTALRYFTKSFLAGEIQKPEVS
jgi:hypothetical protein